MKRSDHDAGNHVKPSKAAVDRAVTIARLYHGSIDQLTVKDSSQTGGVCCNHPEIEGAIIAAAPATIFGIMVDLGDLDGNSAQEDADFALATLQWSSFTKVIDCKIDPSRRSEEGWWSVTFYLQSPLKDEKVGPFRGVIFGPNSD